MLKNIVCFQSGKFPGDIIIDRFGYPIKDQQKIYRKLHRIYYIHNNNNNNNTHFCYWRNNNNTSSSIYEKKKSNSVISYHEAKGVISGLRYSQFHYNMLRFSGNFRKFDLSDAKI